MNRDLFTMPNDYLLAHCISADAKMGAGIAVEFEKRFQLRKVLTTMGLTAPTCVRVGRTLNLVTKEMYWHKPTLKSLTAALHAMKIEIYEYMIDNGLEEIKLAMPKIGCGLDRLNWIEVYESIENEFFHFQKDISIVICDYRR